MSLQLHFHPLSSFSWKVLIALYESGIPFEPHIVHLADEASRREFFALWPLGKMPLLRDEAARRTIPETSIILEYLAHRFPGASWLLPADADATLDVRLRDRIHDLHVQQPMQKIVGDRIRPEGQRDPHGVSSAQAALQTALEFAEQQLATGKWPAGDPFTMADCAAMPALYYANKVNPFENTLPSVWAYLQRLTSRPSVIRVLAEAQPYAHLFPEG